MVCTIYTDVCIHVHYTLYNAYEVQYIPYTSCAHGTHRTRSSCILGGLNSLEYLGEFSVVLVCGVTVQKSVRICVLRVCMSVCRVYTVGAQTYKYYHLQLSTARYPNTRVCMYIVCMCFCYRRLNQV